MWETKVVRTDVIVVGSGAAGLRAAIEARRYHVDVLLIDKSVIGLCSNTRFSGGGIKVALPGMSAAYTSQPKTSFVIVSLSIA